MCHDDEGAKKKNGILFQFLIPDHGRKNNVSQSNLSFQRCFIYITASHCGKIFCEVAFALGCFFFKKKQSNSMHRKIFPPKQVVKPHMDNDSKATSVVIWLHCALLNTLKLLT